MCSNMDEPGVHYWHAQMHVLVYIQQKVVNDSAYVRHLKSSYEIVDGWLRDAVKEDVWY